MKDDGGPAYPHLYEHCQRINESEMYKGLSIRDFFAAAVLQGLVAFQYGGELGRIFDANKKIADAGDERESPQQYTARIAYSLADAMLAERTK